MNPLNPNQGTVAQPGQQEVRREKVKKDQVKKDNNSGVKAQYKQSLKQTGQNKDYQIKTRDKNNSGRQNFNYSKVSK
jgi:hypothetical protein